MPSRQRNVVLALALLAPLAVLLIVAPPIAQDPRYHVFADTRTLLGVPNFFNVASNLAFVLAGGMGALLCMSQRRSGAARAWACFFIAAALVAVGSAYYHWAPGDETLLWDRLPMAIAFMALVSALLAEHVDERLELALLSTTLAVGIAAVAWWRYAGDLRPYVWVQFAPFVALLCLLAVFPPPYSHRAYLGYGAACYGMAKVCELYDAEILRVTGISGHTLKHLLGALAVYCVYRMLRLRIRSRPLP